LQIYFYFDQTRCIGCQACVVACKDWNNIPPGPANWISVETIEEGKFPNLRVSFIIHKCHHCIEPACIQSCPSGAISKRKEDGIVVVHSEICLGKSKCGLCLDSCPYKAPQFREDNQSHMEKCDLCLERWEQGKKPICVMGCPTRALDAGSLEEIESLYGKNHEAIGFIYSLKTKPAIVFRSKSKINNKCYIK